MSNKLSNLTDANAQTSKILQTQIENLFREQWNTLNIICNRYFEGPNDAITESLVIKELRNQLNKIGAPKNLIKIEDSVNQNMENIIARLRHECPFIKENDITFLSLILAGLAPKTICIILDIKLNNFYTKRARLIEKILKTDTKSAELFRSKLSK